MYITVSENEKNNIFHLLQARAEENSLYGIRYLDLGVKIIRVLCYSQGIMSLIDKHLSYVSRSDMENFDSTIIAWQEPSIHDFSQVVCKQFPLKKQIQLRAEMLLSGRSCPIFYFVDNENGFCQNIGRIDGEQKCVEVFDDRNKIAYFGYYTYEPELFVEQGHVFVRQINHLVKNDSVNLTHGAAFGLAGNGFLLCGQGKRGKSTLTVESLLQGFEYVSDDYQLIEKKGTELFAYPVYSMITLSSRMYNEMYDRFHGKFLCNNFTQEKYLFNISSYHSQFRTAYPIKFCLFPEIVADEHPGIVICNPEEKGRAIVQMIYSTLMQMNELGDRKTIRKLLAMIKDLPFIKFNLCNQISENTDYLRKYLSTLDLGTYIPEKLNAKIMDITFGLAIILDVEKCNFIAMNKFATNIFMMMQHGVDYDKIKEYLSQFEKNNSQILDEFDVFVKLLEDRHFNMLSIKHYSNVQFMPEYARKSSYRLSVLEYIDNQTIELVKTGDKV